MWRVHKIIRTKVTENTSKHIFLLSSIETSTSENVNTSDRRRRVGCSFCIRCKIIYPYCLYSNNQIQIQMFFDKSILHVTI